MNDYETIRAEAQQRLIDFLNAELELGPTLVQSAVLAFDAGHMDHYAEAKRGATKAADTIRQFTSGVTDSQVRTKIGKQLAELDRLILTL